MKCSKSCYTDARDTPGCTWPACTRKTADIVKDGTDGITEQPEYGKSPLLEEVPAFRRINERQKAVLTGHDAFKSVALPTDVRARKAIPLATGCLDYFPRALAAIAEVSRIGNEQHNPGQPLHWDKSKSTDHADCILRHLIDRGKLDSDGVSHSAKVAWRALALLEIELEREDK